MATETEIQDLGGATMKVMKMANGYVHPSFGKPVDEMQAIFDNVPNMRFRKDDLMLLTYPKTGTHWMYEILNMILNRSSERIKNPKLYTMIEANTEEAMDNVPSPRVMSSHYLMRYLPVKGLQEKQIKTVLCLRNPKDTAVSDYNHVKGFKSYGYTGQFSDWLPLYTQGKLEYGSYMDYLKELETAIKQGIGFPLHIMYYEDLKANGLEELERLLKFLDIELEQELKESIMDMCGFDKMVSKNRDKADQLKEGFKFFRKGQVGNWKEWFTVAESEQFDEYWNKQMEGYDMFKFKYTF